ncbi:M3 family metallopeptidase [Demequina pelophila]|uniref:M3 family metallopeptidase n=1 Tax=Demequina pelophila TaxID=1638984 RepID=UPI000781FE4E|nr:M3 family metallopeptidase [Demequina pelophila]
MTDALPPLTLPAHDEPWLNFSRDYVGSRLDEARALLARVRAGRAGGARGAGGAGDAGDAGDADALATWDAAATLVMHAEQFASALSEVHPDADVRKACSDLHNEVVRFRLERDSDPALFAAIEATTTPDDALAARARDLTLLDFRLQGAHLDDATRARLTELNSAISEATTEFSENIRDAVGRVRVPAEALDGLPEDFKASHPADDEGLVTITTDYPDLVPFMDMSRDRAARRQLLEADYLRAYPENDAVLARLLELRDEKARLLGYPDFPDYAVATMMMPSGDAIEEFIADVNTAARPAGLADRERLLARLRQDVPDATELTAADNRYYIEVLKEELFGVSPHEVRRYIDFAKVRDGILDLTGRLFDVSYEPVDAPSWDADVTAYDVMSEGERIGRIRLDMHPREGKFGHMACFPLVNGLEGRHLPEASLVCNFPRGLMTFDDLLTFLHEFGHLVHAIFSGHGRFARLAGLSEAGEWDFVEAPSQLLEEWAYSHEVLKEFATDADGNPIPAELVDALRASRDFCEGLLTCRQLTYATLSYRLHRDHPTDIAPVAEQIEREMDVRDPIPGTRQYCSFGHLTGYSACYYTYQWSLSIAKDLFTAFDPEHLTDPAVTRRYRDLVLSPGGEKPAAQLIEDFLGRPYSTQAYRDWLGSLAG